MRIPMLFSFVTATMVLNCAAHTDPASGNTPAAVNTPATSARPGDTRLFSPAGPQSYTPDTRQRPRPRAIKQLWSVPIGATDHRSTIMFADGAVWVGARGGRGAQAGVYVIDPRDGSRRDFVPTNGDVVGLALDRGRLCTTTALGTVAMTTREGSPLFSATVGAPITTAPTLVDLDGDGLREVVVGDTKGKVTALDGKTGKVRWTRAFEDPRPSIGSGLAAADIDGDGKVEIVGGTEGGRLFALTEKGDLIWELRKPSALRAAPLLSDVDGDRRLEAIAGWADGEVAIVDGKSGKELWSTRVENDDGEATGVLASPTPMPGGSLLVATSRWGAEDSVVLLRPHGRAYRAKQGSVVGAPILGTIDPEAGIVEAIVGTIAGDVLSFDASGGMSLLYHLDGRIEASLLLADIETNGLRQLVLATTDGRLIALAVHATTPPLHGRARGSLQNDGVLAPTTLGGWPLRRSR